MDTLYIDLCVVNLSNLPLVLTCGSPANPSYVIGVLYFQTRDYQNMEWKSDFWLALWGQRKVVRDVAKTFKRCEDEEIVIQIASDTTLWQETRDWRKSVRVRTREYETVAFSRTLYNITMGMASTCYLKGVQYVLVNNTSNMILASTPSAGSKYLSDFWK